MAKTKIDTLKWLREDMGFSEAEATELLPKFDSRADKLSEGYMRQSDYDRLANEAKQQLKTQQDDLSSARERLNAEIAEWGVMQAEGKTATAQQQKDLEDARIAVARLTSALERTAAEAGLDPKKALEGVEVKVAQPAGGNPPAPDLSNYISRDDLNKATGPLASMALRLPAIFARIGREHRALTGQDLNEEEIVQEIERRADQNARLRQNLTLDPVAIWEEKHQIPTKRQEVAQKQHDDELAAAEQRGFERAMTQSSIPGQSPAGRHAPVFRTPAGEAHVSKLQRPQPSDKHSNALAALRTGKYRSEPVGAGAPGHK